MKTMRAPIILLKEGTDSSQGKAQLISNINACEAIVDSIKTTLGPRGMDKLIVNSKGVTISNDGATIMKLLDIVHPAGKTLVDIAKSQDAEIGDGTTSVVLLAGSLLKECKPFIEEGVHPQIITKAYRLATQLVFFLFIVLLLIHPKALTQIDQIALHYDLNNSVKKRELLEKIALTSMSSKLINSHKDFFVKLVVDAVSLLDEDLPLDMIGIKKVSGGTFENSMLIEGVAFKKAFSYAGFEMAPKTYKNPKICLLHIELELKAERDNAEVRVDNVEEYQNIVDAEWNILYSKLEKIVNSGAKVVLSKLPIGDVATQFFADRDVFCAGRIPEDDMKRTAKACRGAIQTSVNNLSMNLGTCGKFEEIQIGGERYNIFSQCPLSQTCTIILRGGAEQFIAETERSLHDAIMVVRRTIKNEYVVAGGGAIEMAISTYLKNYACSVSGKSQMLIASFAKALECIPRQLCDNAGFDGTNILNILRKKHNDGEQWYGVDMRSEGVADNLINYVWEPSVMKRNVIKAASEAACVILTVDETIKNPSSSQNDKSTNPSSHQM